MNKYPLALSSWSKSEKTAIKKVIDSGNFTMGKKVLEFEEIFSKYVGSKFSVMCNSGSSANLLMIAALFYRKNNKLKKGDEVIVPAVSWSTTYSPLYQYGLKIKFVDIDKETLNFDLKKLKNAITNKTKAILAVNLLGNINDYESIKKMIEGTDIILLEDNCESLGAKLNGKQAGTFGIMGTYSTFFSHHICTMEGGLVVTDDKELYHILLSLRAHGWTRNLPKNNEVCSEKSDNNFFEMYRFILPGYNLRPLEISGAIGIEQIKKFDKFLNNRRKNAKYFYKKIAKKYEKYFFFQKEIGESSFFGFSIICKNNVREELIQFLTENSVECRPIVTGNFAKNDVVKKYYDYEIFDNLENANLIDKNGFFVGNHHFYMKKEIDYLDNLLEVFFKKGE